MGTTDTEEPYPFPTTVHPHVCGDDLIPGSAAGPPPGSPPRVWGRLGALRQHERIHRFTPTCVGTTLWERSKKLADVRFTPTCVGTTPLFGRFYTNAAVHPHVCGDDPPGENHWRFADGSPPRVWGRQPHAVHRRHPERFTPTCVGTTEPGSRCLQSHSVHPHVCGDDHAGEHRAAGVIGSPPRVWGRHELRVRQRHRPRFTPTCVGTTSGRPRRAPRPSVHPHVCGDDRLKAGRLAYGPGSPPRVWGRLVTVAIRRGQARFTPTCVGTTHRAGSAALRRAVHPHVCGDDGVTYRVANPRRGSPPRVWGRRPGHWRDQGPQRFTPTCVGTTSSMAFCMARCAVHPHVCGDDTSADVSTPGGSGSPPRVWGRLVMLVSPSGRGRFTPTCVGTTRAPAGARAGSEVHPHVCGDDVRRAHSSCMNVGSPPRVWGRPLIGAVRRGLSRFTPTCVGTTCPFTGL